MKDGYIGGLQLGIDLFALDVERHVLALDEVQRNGGDVILQTKLRAGLRAYANVVGALKLKLAESNGGNWQDRFSLRRVREVCNLNRKSGPSEPYPRVLLCPDNLNIPFTGPRDTS